MSDGRIRQIVAVDDNERLLRFVASALGADDCHVTTFTSGPPAIAYLRDTNTCDLLVLDVHMPEMDGFEVVRAIRELEGDIASMPILALTALSEPDGAARILQVGADAYLHKPVTVGDLREVAQALLEAPAAPHPAAATEAQAPRQADGESVREALVTLAERYEQGAPIEVGIRPPWGTPPTVQRGRRVRIVSFTLDDGPDESADAPVEELLPLTPRRRLRLFPRQPDAT